MPEDKDRQIKWDLPGNSFPKGLHLTRNVGGIFKVYNDGQGDVELVKAEDPDAPKEQSNVIHNGRTVLVQIAPGSDLVIGLIDPHKAANGTFELVTHLTT